VIETGSAKGGLDVNELVLHCPTQRLPADGKKTAARLPPTSSGSREDERRLKDAHKLRRIRYIFCDFNMLKSILSPIPEADGECRAF
jgi:hypothetical protein